MGDEATGSRWSRNIDIAAKLLIPIALFGGSAILSASQQKEAKFQACAQRLFDFSKAACHESGECGARTQSEGVFLTGLVATVERLCTEANFEVPQEWWASAAPSIAQSNNVAATGEATKASGRVPQTSASSSIAGGELAKTTLEPSAATQTQLAAIPSGGPHPVVYVQYSDAGQSDAVKTLVARLNTAQFVGTTLTVPAPELVETQIAANELRCFKTESCKETENLAAYLQAVLGAPVRVADLSKRYDGNAKIRTWTYELWLAPGPLPLRSG